MRPEYLLIYEDKWKTWNKVCVYIKISGRKLFVCVEVITLRNTLHIYFCIPWGPGDLQVAVTKRIEFGEMKNSK